MRWTKSSSNWKLLHFLLFSFIENYGTHIVTSATVGGRDVVYIRQHQSSSLSASDIENYVKDIGDDRFHNVKHFSGPGPLKYKEKVSINKCLYPTITSKHTTFSTTYYLCNFLYFMKIYYSCLALFICLLLLHSISLKTI